MASIVDPESDGKSNIPRGICPGCSGTFTLRKDGLLRHHLGNEWEPNGIFRKLCGGVGHIPEVHV